MSFWGELKRRNVVSVAVTYAVVAWLVVQVAALLLDTFSVADWVMQGIVIVLALGFPVALVIAWAYEITAGGIRRDDKIAPGETRASNAGWRLNAIVIGILSAAVILFATDRFFLAGEGDAASESPSLAVLPFQFDSQGIANYFQQIPAELTRLLGRNGQLRIISPDAVNALPSNGSLSQFASQLGSRFIVIGSLEAIDRNLQLHLSIFDGILDDIVFQKSYGDAHLQQTSATVAADVMSAIGVEPSRIRTFEIDNEAFENYLRAKQLLSVEPFSAEAEGLLLESIRISSRFAAAFAALCDLYQTRYTRFDDTSDFTRAEQNCIRAWTIDNESVEVLTSLASLSLIGGQIDRARDYAEGALAVSPNYYPARIVLAGTFESEQPDVAELMYERIITENPGSPDARQRLQTLLFYQGRAEEAVAIQRDVVRLVPNDESAVFNLSSNLMLAGEFIEAQELIERVLEEIDEGSPMVGEFENNLATIRFFTGDYEGAASLYRRAVSRSSSQNPNLQRNLGDAVWHAQGPESAQVIFQTAIAYIQDHLAINPESDVFLADEIVAAASVGDADRFAQLQSRALAGTAGDDPQVLYSIAVGASRLGDFDTAKVFTQQSVDAGYPLAFLTADPDIALAGGL